MSEDTTQQLLVARVDRLISLVEETNKRLDEFDARQHELKTEIDNLNAKVDQRLHDTRPIWESVQSRLDGVESRLDVLDQRQARLDERCARIEVEVTQFRAETASSFRAIGRKIGALANNQIEIEAELQDAHYRIDKLESHSA